MKTTYYENDQQELSTTFVREYVYIFVRKLVENWSKQQRLG